MSGQEPDRPPDPAGPHARWWEDVYTVGWAVERHDAELVGRERAATAALDMLIARCAAQLHPSNTAAPTSGSLTRQRIVQRMRHLAKVSDTITGSTTEREVRRVLEVYGPLARAHHEGHDALVDVDERLDRLAAGAG